MKKVSVIGAGAWGTTLGILLGQNGHEVSIWSYEKEVVEQSKLFRENKKYLEGFPLSSNIEITDNIKKSISKANLILFVVPTQHLRQVIKSIASDIQKDTIILSASKGFEISTLKRPTEIISEFIQNELSVISGPNLAKEIAKGLPAASVIASKNAAEIQTYFKECKTFRVYTSLDVVGVESGGALKNVIAIAAGAIDGASLGDNAKAALVIRGISEISRLGVAMGAKIETFSGLSGLGDLITTCASDLSRNHKVGYSLAKGEKLEQILAKSKDVAEGVPTTKAAIALAKKYKVEMPITEEIYKVLFENKNIDKAIMDLMTRPLKSED